MPATRGEYTYTIVQVYSPRVAQFAPQLQSIVQSVKVFRAKSGDYKLSAMENYKFNITFAPQSQA